MTKVQQYHLIKDRLLILLCFALISQVLLAQKNYSLNYLPADRTEADLFKIYSFENRFNSKSACISYVNKLPALLRAKGYATASVDSATYDSLSATIKIFIGKQYRWAYMDASLIDKKILSETGWSDKAFNKQLMDFDRIGFWQERLLNYMENNGYPFAKVEMDSVRIEDDKVYARMRIEKGPLYKIDSMRVFGNLKISKNFLQRYLSIPDGSIYKKDKLQLISRRLMELPYLQETQPANMNLLSTGSVLNLYLAAKRSSQINALVGFLPANQQLGGTKLLFTADVNINLKNPFGSGETIGLIWQQIQPKSPRINLSYEHPYIFNSALGLDFMFELLSKDSSYINVNFRLGMQYVVSGKQTGKIFYESFITNLRTIDTLQIKSSRRLDKVDLNINHVGMDYEFINTNYRFNPRKGNEFRVIGAVGIKNIKRNPVILNLKDPFDPDFNFGKLYDTLGAARSYQFKVRFTGAQYFPIGKNSTFKTGLNVGWLQSPQVFRNEMFQIGGYRLLRGFDEESIYANRYVTTTFEYRYLNFMGPNSYLFSFIDAGWTYDNTLKSSLTTKPNSKFLGFGIGMNLETKVGLFNMSYAVGKQNSDPINFRQAKIHFGYINYF
jgi:outer membrane protein assembly factor BamA